jgi:hypothetical protein
MVPGSDGLHDGLRFGATDHRQRGEFVHGRGVEVDQVAKEVEGKAYESLALHHLIGQALTNR